MKPGKVISAKYLKDYIFEFEFSDGFSNIVDLKNELWGEMFTSLLDVYSGSLNLTTLQ
ncbi:MAG: hypothetical protein M3R36_08755 [Bacteroidota bacterium]|nr:hypothetical protein [Bacteroidota bacterium]